MTEYRVIDFKGLCVPREHYDAVAVLLDAAGWEPEPTPDEQKQLVRVYPTTKDRMHAEQIEVFKEIAPYVTTGSKAILEVRRDPTPWEAIWLHLVYQDGQVREIETAAGQWDVVLEAGGA
jgi:hypothetical protein